DDRREHGARRPGVGPAPMTGAGGTSGGVGMFFGGAAMVVAGGYLLLTRVTVAGNGGWVFFGDNAFGLSLFPLVIGIRLLFYDGRSIPGWLLTAGGALIIVVGIIANLHIYFQPSSLFDTLLMLVLIAAGLGLVARSLREIPTDDLQ